MRQEKIIILGAGVTGLAAGIKTSAPIYEATSYTGGICHSYLKKGYRFELSGGHWLFGDDSQVLDFIQSLSPLNFYQRNSAVFFPKENLYIPYPLQNHLSLLPKEDLHRIRHAELISASKKILNQVQNDATYVSPTEIAKQSAGKSATFAEWLEESFGKALCQFFFFPFHKLYTAGLYTLIAPQDTFKTPTQPIKSYNVKFAYPKNDLDHLIEKMAEKCQIHYNHKIIKIDLQRKEIIFENGRSLKYQRIISTLPLNKMIQMSGIKIDEPPPPYTSVLVTNIGAQRGRKCPSHHWLYIPQSKTGFYRVGFYSNVDSFFLPPKQKEKVSLYVEKAYLGGQKPTQKEVEKLCHSIIEELTDWQFISEVDVIHPTWIETAYTYSWPDSAWREKALKALEKENIYQVGRYGRWRFQGILDSIKEGLGFRV